MTELARRYGDASARPALDDDFGDQHAGRHAFNEDAVLTPIFHALTRGGWRRRQEPVAPDPVDAFRRDPLTAPIPIQAYDATGPSGRPGRHRQLAQYIAGS